MFVPSSLEAYEISRDPLRIANNVRLRIIKPGPTYPKLFAPPPTIGCGRSAVDTKGMRRCGWAFGRQIQQSRVFRNAARWQGYLSAIGDVIVW